MEFDKILKIKYQELDTTEESIRINNEKLNSLQKEQKRLLIKQTQLIKIIEKTEELKSLYEEPVEETVEEQPVQEAVEEAVEDVVEEVVEEQAVESEVEYSITDESGYEFIEDENDIVMVADKKPTGGYITDITQEQLDAFKKSLHKMCEDSQRNCIRGIKNLFGYKANKRTGKCYVMSEAHSKLDIEAMQNDFNAAWAKKLFGFYAHYLNYLKFYKEAEELTSVYRRCKKQEKTETKKKKEKNPHVVIPGLFEFLIELSQDRTLAQDIRNYFTFVQHLTIYSYVEYLQTKIYRKTPENEKDISKYAIFLDKKVYLRYRNKNNHEFEMTKLSDQAIKDFERILGNWDELYISGCTQEGLIRSVNAFQSALDDLKRHRKLLDEKYNYITQQNLRNYQCWFWKTDEERKACQIAFKVCQREGHWLQAMNQSYERLES